MKRFFFLFSNAFKVSHHAWLAQLGKRRSADREVTVSNPGRTNTQWNGIYPLYSLLRTTKKRIYTESCATTLRTKETIWF